MIITKWNLFKYDFSPYRLCHFNEKLSAKLALLIDDSTKTLNVNNKNLFELMHDNMNILKKFIIVNNKNIVKVKVQSQHI